MEQKHETYYVPEESKLPIFASVGLFLTVFGLGSWINAISVARKTGEDFSITSLDGFMVFVIGLVFFCGVLYTWFATVVKENIAGLNSAQLKRSYVWGMGWFIFSEVMFFAAFFGALYYIRTFALTWLSEGDTSALMWNDFKAEWPLMSTPDQALNGDKATVVGPGENMSNPGLLNWFGWLPFWNTVLLLASSVTVHMAHVSLKDKAVNKKFNIWLAVTVSLGFLFLVLQAEEYIHAYHVGLKLDSGVYGTTFFMLTGFHGLHVTLGSVMLLVQLLRSVDSWLWRGLAIGGLISAYIIAFSVGQFSLMERMLIVGLACAVIIVIAFLKPKPAFSHDDCFGFEASSWYWHFVDVVWVGLFLFVYVWG